jgi:hypothetical protein
MYNLVDPLTHVQLEQAHELVDLFKKLDSYTAQNRLIVITDESGEVVAGNVIAMQFAGLTIKTA